jgi:hypothetical protein
MPIPPTGWGAVEILIWDYAVALRRLGHQVTIINTPDRKAIVTQVQEAKADVVHLQYDELHDLAETILQHTRIVLVTSHFAYIEQRERWGGYKSVFHLLIPHNNPRIFHYALSPGIADVYARYGVPRSHIRVRCNGADDASIQYTDTPQFPERSLCVGKIERRKRQAFLSSIDNVWFAGNACDSMFNYSHERYLGEWKKPTLFESLTDYANLVLISDGEADPLVVKEALVAGLGLVLSPCAAANLDTSLPFITVLKATELYDVTKMAEAIRRNRDVSVPMRAHIRTYSERFFWRHIAQEYAEQIQKDLDLCDGDTQSHTT